MTKLRISTLTDADDAAACRLERACVQGGSLAVRFSRPSFKARSDVYDDALILGGWIDGALVGTVAAARKRVHLNGETITAAYFYDMRVHPDYRKRGCARALMCAIVDRMGGQADCLYILVAGQNERMLSLVGDHFRYRSEVALPLTYMCLPAFRRRPSAGYEEADPVQIRCEYLRETGPTFVPEYDEGRYRGHVMSIRVDGAGCSIWSNEEILAEEIVRMPPALRMLRGVGAMMSPIVPFPSVPAPGEPIRSWFLYDVHARSDVELSRLLCAANNLALSFDRSVLYLLLPEADPLLAWIRRYQRIRFNFPYRMLIRGRSVPKGGNVYVDVRDL